MLRLLVWVAVASASSAEKLLSLVKFVLGINSKSLCDALTPEELASLESSLGAEFVDALEHKEKAHIARWVSQHVSLRVPQSRGDSEAWGPFLLWKIRGASSRL